LFLATGESLRSNAAKFHEKVAKAVTIISERIGIEAGSLKVRDHQHITYDIFANEKGNKESMAHTFREIATRYKQQDVEVDEGSTAVTYAVVSMPMTRRLLKDIEIDYEADKPFELLYNKISKAFTESIEKHHLNNVAMIANGLSPIVRFDEGASTVLNGDIISLGYNPHNEGRNISCQWEGDKLVDTIRLVFFATDSDETHKTYGKFVNQVTQAINTMADALNWKKDTDNMLLRMNQQLVRRL
jgi:hypothetical protein